MTNKLPRQFLNCLQHDLVLDDEPVQSCHLLVKKLQLLKKLEEDVAAVNLEISALASHAQTRLEAEDPIKKTLLELQSICSEKSSHPASCVSRVITISTDESNKDVTQDSQSEDIHDASSPKISDQTQICGRTIMALARDLLHTTEAPTEKPRGLNNQDSPSVPPGDAPAVNTLEDTLSLELAIKPAAIENSQMTNVSTGESQNEVTEQDTPGESIQNVSFYKNLDIIAASEHMTGIPPDNLSQEQKVSKDQLEIEVNTKGSTSTSIQDASGLRIMEAMPVCNPTMILLSGDISHINEISPDESRTEAQEYNPQSESTYATVTLETCVDMPTSKMETRLPASENLQAKESSAAQSELGVGEKVSSDESSRNVLVHKLFEDMSMSEQEVMRLAIDRILADEASPDESAIGVHKQKSRGTTMQDVAVHRNYDEEVVSELSIMQLAIEVIQSALTAEANTQDSPRTSQDSSTVKITECTSICGVLTDSLSDIDSDIETEGDATKLVSRIEADSQSRESEPQAVGMCCETDFDIPASESTLDEEHDPEEEQGGNETVSEVSLIVLNY